MPGTDREPKGGSKTFDDLMLAGFPYQRLVAAKDKPLSPSDQEEQQRKLEETVKQRRNEYQQQQAQRIAKYQKSRKHDYLFLEQRAEAFDFKLAGQRKLAGKEVYVLRAFPRPGLSGPQSRSASIEGHAGNALGDDIWLPKHYAMRARAKVFLLLNHMSGKDDTYFNCRKIPPNQETSPSYRASNH